jgi:hypothetical protein
MDEIMAKEDYIKDLDSLLQLINSDPLIMKAHELAGLAYLYSMFMADKKFDLNLIDFSEHYLKCIQGLDANHTPEILKEKRDFFSELRLHAEKSIQGIVEGVAKEDEFEIQCSAPVGIRLKVTNGRIKSYYFLSSQEPDQGLSLKHEKDKIDVLFLNIINALGSDLMRIKKCKKDGCDTFFWQPTNRDKNYCSQKCAGAVRQRRFVDGKPKQ